MESHFYEHNVNKTRSDINVKFFTLSELILTIHIINLHISKVQGPLTIFFLELPMQYILLKAQEKVPVAVRGFKKIFTGYNMKRCCCNTAAK